jgi:hypothetical protein
MVMKWAVLQRPMSIRLASMHRLVVAIGKLHNFTINERLLESKNKNSRINPNELNFNDDLAALRLRAANFQCEDMIANRESRVSHNRNEMAQYIADNDYTRPGSNRYKIFLLK